MKRDAGTKVRAAACVFGALFGFMISWGQFTDPDRIREMLLLEDLYLYEMMFTAMAIGFVGIHLLRRRNFRTLLDGSPVTWETSKPERRHIVGAATFGVGWALTDSCPGPIAGQLAQGVWWSLFTLAGLLIGIELYFRRQEGRSLFSRGTRAPRATAAPAAVSD